MVWVCGKRLVRLRKMMRSKKKMHLKRSTKEDAAFKSKE